MGQLFDTTKQNISLHMQNILTSGELPNSTVKEFLIVQKEGKRSVSRKIIHCNLDMIISVGYRIKSAVATQFRIWATDKLKKYLVDGYAINEKRLQTKNEQIKKLQNSIISL